MSKGVVWLASYPKSGNTWLRAIIASLLNEGHAPDLNALSRLCPHGAARSWIEDQLEFPTEDFKTEELRAARVEAYRAVTREGEGLLCLKVHDRYDPTLFPEELSAGAIYVVRDPRDVAPSWADHMNVSIDETIERMGRSGFRAGRSFDSYRGQTEQILGSWSEHVSGWTQETRVRTLVLKYEDMLAAPREAVTQVASFLDLNASAEVAARTARACRFENLQSLEQEHGFAERLAHQKSFFRKGTAGSWRAILNAGQQERLLADHGQAMDWVAAMNSGERLQRSGACVTVAGRRG